MDAIVALRDTPIPTILVVTGIIFLLLAVAGGVVGKVEVPPERQKWAAGIGGILLLVGLAMWLFVPQNGSGIEVQQQPAVAEPSIASEATGAVVPTAAAREPIVSADNAFSSPIELRLGTSEKFKVTEADALGFFQFTPSTTGVYTISTISEPNWVDQGWILFDDDTFSREVQRCDFDMPSRGLERCSTDPLEANRTYYLGVFNLTGDQTNEPEEEVIFTVTIESANSVRSD